MFNLPDEFLENLKGAMQDERVRLPFAAPILWWKNGSKALKQVGGVSYFGGWAITASDLSNMDLEPPPGFVLETWSNKAGTSDFEVYASRAVYFAPIVHRKRWELKKGDDNQNKRTSHVQILGVMANIDKASSIAYYGPAILTGKAFAGTEIENSLREFDKGTREVRGKYAPGYPSNLFYASIGTFGKDPVIKNVGKVTQSPITPCKCWLPEVIDEKALQVWFVGADTAEAMTTYKSQAQEWLDDWKEKRDEQPEDFIPPMPDNEMPF